MTSLSKNKDKAQPLSNEQIKRELGLDLIEAQREKDKIYLERIQNSTCNPKLELL